MWSEMFRRLLGKLWGRAKAFKMATRGAATVNNAIVLAVAFLVAAIAMPIGIGQIYSANTTGWNTAVTTIFTILFPILGVIGAALPFIPARGGK